MNVITLVDFHDNLRNVDRKRGEEFVVSRERFEEINSIGQQKIGKAIVEAVVDRAQKQSPEDRSGKATAKRRAARKAE